jgi:hypothetical protein
MVRVAFGSMLLQTRWPVPREHESRRGRWTRNTLDRAPVISPIPIRGFAAMRFTPGKLELISSAHCRSTWPSGQKSIAGRWCSTSSSSKNFACFDSQSKYASAVGFFPVPGELNKPSVGHRPIIRRMCVAASVRRL